MSARLAGVRVPAHERTVLENGLTLIVIPRHDVPLIAFNAVMRGGGCADEKGKAGVASLVAGLLEKGAGARDAFDFIDAVEGVGGTFSAGAGPESIAVRGQFLARDQHLLLELLADALMHPRFDPREFESLRARQIELIKATKDSDPGELISTYGRAFLFADHPYGRPTMGSEASLAAITHEDILAYQRAQFGADRLTLIVAGDVDVSWLQRSVSRLFARWSPAARACPSLPTPVRLTDRRVLVVDAPGSTQAHFWIGNVGVDRHYPQRGALELVNTLYGGRFTSLLNTALRVKSGLSYGARSGFAGGSVAGEFAIRSFAQTRHAGKALALALSTLGQLQAHAVSAQMLESARAYLLGQYPLDFETVADWAIAMGEVELYGLGAAHIEAYADQLQTATLAQTREVIRSVFPSPQAVAVVLIGDARALRAQLAESGTLTQIALAQPHFDPRAAAHLRDAPLVPAAVRARAQA